MKSSFAKGFICSIYILHLYLIIYYIYYYVIVMINLFIIAFKVFRISPFCFLYKKNFQIVNKIIGTLNRNCRHFFSITLL